MEQCTGKLNRKSLPRFNTGASERVRCSSLTLFSSHLTSLLVTRDAIQEFAAPSLFGDTSRKGCRRGFSSFLNSTSCPAHYSCILSVDRGGCLHVHLQAPRCPLCLTFHQWTRPHQFLRFSRGRGFIRGSAVWPTQQTH